MKNEILIITCLCVAVFAGGCKRSEETSAAQQLDKVKTETKEAAQDMKDYAYAQKTEFVTHMQSQLDQINRDLDQLAAKVEKASDAAKAEAKPKLQALRDQVDLLKQELDKAKDATETTWDTVKARSRKAFEALKDGFQQARQWASDKIAP